MRCSVMASAPTRVWRVQSYSDQENTVWPNEGRHILAQYDGDTVVVYQAYCAEIADYAVKHQKYVSTCWYRVSILKAIGAVPRKGSGSGPQTLLAAD